MKRRDWLGATAGYALLASGAAGTAGPLIPRLIGAAEAAGSDQVWPFDQPPLAELRQSKRRVLAWWHVFRISQDNKDPKVDIYSTQYMRPEGLKGRYQSSGGWIRERPLPRAPLSGDWLVKDMQEDIRRAVATGMDGFIFNLTEAGTTSSHWQNLQAMLKAVPMVDKEFKVALSLDGATWSARKASSDDAIKAIMGVADNPSMMRTEDGRLMLSSFAPERQPPGWWGEVVDGLQKRDVRPFFLGVYLDPRNIAPDLAKMTDIQGRWGGNSFSAVPGLRPQADGVKAAGKVWMAPVYTQDSRPKAGIYWEAQNSELFRACWAAAIDYAEWVDIITWNDYSESSEISPSTGVQYSYYDLTAYYIAWFKLRKQPPIVRDVLYYFHRVETAASSRSAGALPFFKLQANVREPSNDIELLAFLKEPGELSIEIGGQVKTMQAPAGITSFKVPLALGKPRFGLRRNGKPVIDFESAFDIHRPGLAPDLLYRGGSSTRPPVAMLANDPV